jgi:membrane associated rhomboid family serine protease
MLLWFHLVTGPVAQEGGYFAPGVLATGLVRHGEWWRLVTALTLHADFPHVAANSMALFLLGIAASHQLGPGLAWLLAFAGGVGGNALEAFVTDPERHSLGASTSVFAFVAILGALRFVALIRAEGPPKSVWARSWLPLFGALGALGFLGTSHGSDVAGHALGFVSGGLLGVVAALLPRRRLGDLWQFLLCTIPLAIVTWAWHEALLHSAGS